MEWLWNWCRVVCIWSHTFLIFFSCGNKWTQSIWSRIFDYFISLFFERHKLKHCRTMERKKRSTWPSPPTFFWSHILSNVPQLGLHKFQWNISYFKCCLEWTLTWHRISNFIKSGLTLIKGFLIIKTRFKEPTLNHQFFVDSSMETTHSL
jgi:hypothetical protein